MWTTHRSGVLDLRDAIVVLTMDGYLFSPSTFALEIKPKRHLAWPSPAAALPDFAAMPCVLNKPVQTVDERCDLQPHYPAQPIQDQLKEVLGGEDYRHPLGEWMLEYKHLLSTASNWLAARGLDFQDYVGHLARVVCVTALRFGLSVLLQQLITVVQEDTIWSSL